MKLPYVIVVSDGVVMRSLHPPSFSLEDRAALDRIIMRELFSPLTTTPAAAIAVAPLRAAAQPYLQIRAREQGYEGDPCESCGEFKLKRAGHCLVCDACGTTTGCS